MQHPDEGTIHAWIDGELPADDAAALEAHLQECAECSALAAEARGLAAASSRIVSALDIVPGGVIPKSAPRRPWYASTQLRAAAAVAIVAGASLLVMREGDQKKAMRAVSDTAAAASQISQLQSEPAASRPEAARVAEAPAPIVQKNSAKQKPEGRTRSELDKSAANDAAKITAPEDLVAPPAAASRAAADEVSAVKPPARRDSAQRRTFTGDLQLSEVVVTGVATAAAEPGELKKLRTDSSTSATVYEASPGVEVTLFDRGLTVVMRASTTAQLKEKQKAEPAAAPPPTPAPTVEALSRKVAGAMNAAQVNSISWTDKRGHLMVLTGPLSKEQLEGIRKRLPADKR